MKNISEMDKKTKMLCIRATLIALTTVFTMVVVIPMPASGGYINAGDAVILVSAVFFGGGFGAAAGGIGSALADILLGYAHWAPFTLVIKGLMGLMAGYISDYRARGKIFSLRTVTAVLVSEVFMVAGYFLAEAFFRGGFLSASQSLPGNSFQGAGGVIMFFAIGSLLHKSGFLKTLK